MKQSFTTPFLGQYPWHRRSLFVAVAVVLPLIPSTALANPLFSIGEGGDMSWSEALAGQLISPVGQLSDAAFQYYDAQIGDHGVTGIEPFLPELTPDILVSDGNEEHLSLVMAWDPPDDPGLLSIAQWEYAYGADPDLTGTTVEFSVFPPSPDIWDISIELIDADGDSRFWLRTGPAPVWANHAIDPAVAGPQAGFDVFIESGTFDITTVMQIRLNESFMGNVLDFPANPAGTLPVWNSWYYLRVVPAPGIFSLFAVSGLIATRRRR